MRVLTYQKALNGYTKVFCGARFIGTVKKETNNWSAQPRLVLGRPILKNGRTSTDAVYRTREHAAQIMASFVASAGYPI